MDDSNTFNSMQMKRIVLAAAQADGLAPNELATTAPDEYKPATQQSLASVGVEEQLDEHMAAWESEGGHLAFLLAMQLG